MKHTATAYLYRALAEILAGIGFHGRPHPGKHLLIICTFFPPCVSGGTYRPLYWTKLALQFGWKPTVVTQSPGRVESKAGAELLAAIDPEVNVVRLPATWIKPSAKWFPSTDGALPAAFYYAWTTIRQLRRSPPSLVLVSGPGFDNFTMARLVARYFRVPLVLDYRDEWSDSPFSFVKKRTHDRTFEELALASARMAIFTTRSQLETNRRSFNANPERMIVPNGWDERIFVSRQWQQKKRNGTATIRYTGALGGHVAPLEFFTTLAEARRLLPNLMERLNFRFSGSADEAVIQAVTNLNLDNLVSFDDAVPQSDVPGLLYNADALLILYPPIMERYIPGKFYDYMVSGRPILVVGRGRGEVPTIVREVGAGLVSEDTSARCLIKMIESFLESSDSEFQGPKRQKWVEQNSRYTATSTLMKALNRIVAERASA